MTFHLTIMLLNYYYSPFFLVLCISLSLFHSLPHTRATFIATTIARFMAFFIFCKFFFSLRSIFFHFRVCCLFDGSFVAFDEELLHSHTYSSTYLVSSSIIYIISENAFLSFQKTRFTSQHHSHCAIRRLTNAAQPNETENVNFVDGKSSKIKMDEKKNRKRIWKSKRVFQLQQLVPKRASS